MKILTLAKLGAAGLMMCACGAKGADAYTVTVDLTPDANERMAYLLDFDTSEPIDSVLVAGNKAVFTGTAGDPRLARVTVGDNRVAVLVLEPGNITFDPKKRCAEGTPLNARFNAITDSMQAVVDQFRALNPASADYAVRSAALEERYNALGRNAIDDNADNPVGFYFFLSEASQSSLPELKEMLKKHPQFASSQLVGQIQEALTRRHETSAGHKYKDFTVSYDGREQRLSEYVKPGRYTLVDFWASWCGPCIRESKTIKALKEKYGDRLDIVGVAVWDEPDNTLAAIKRLDLTWPQIINAGNVPTDLYGIQGIPTILLIGPDGTILSRDKQGAELEADVEAALGRQ